MYSSRRGRSGGTVLEWLKLPASKHSPSSIAEVNEETKGHARAIVNRHRESKGGADDSQVLEPT